MQYAIQLTNLKKDYAAEKALGGITLQVPSGTLFGLIGADGAGKTTLLRIISTLISQYSGEAIVLNRNASTEFRAIRRHLGYMPQKFSLYSDLSVKENMMFFADIFDVSPEQRSTRIKRLLEFSRLAPFKDRRARDLSGGMKQKLALCCTLIHTPLLLLLDEPTIGVDPVSRREFWEILKELKSQGITIIVSTPYMDEAAMCDELAIMHKGALIAQGSPTALLSGYPHHLYRIGSTHATLTVAASIAPPTGVSLMYPSEGNIHIAVQDTTLLPEQIFSLLKPLMPRAESIHKITPSIEDLFIHLLSQQSAT